MPRRRSPRLLVAAVATVVSLFSPQVASAVPPALDWDVADPALVADGDVLRLYSTNVAAWGALLNVPSYRSTDGGTTWEQTGDVLPELGGWAVPGATWAPDVHRFGATWVLYYTARVADAGTLQCIGVATAATPTGPFVDERGHPIACQGHLGGSIDPSVFVDADGVPWLLYKSDENALGLRSSRLWSRQLTADGTDVVGPEHELLGRDRLWEGHLVEQPEMVAAAGRAWLLYSANDWESGTYGVGFATCEGPTGPCDKRTVGGPWLSRTDHAAGIGGASVAALPDGRAILAYHGWEPGRTSYDSGGRRALHVEPLTFTVDGPTILGRESDVSWSHPGFVDVPGDAFYAEPVRWLAAEGVTTGVGGSDRFAPAASVTRGEMATFLWRHAGAPASGGPLFADVAHGAFYATAVRWLAGEGITTGVGGSDRFAPEAPVTRGEMATFLWRRAGRPHGAGGAPFVDVAPHAFHATAVRWLAAEGITTGVGGTDLFAPDAAVTRGEMATFLWRFDHRGHGAAAGQPAGTATLGGPPSTSGPASPPQAPGAAVRLDRGPGPPGARTARSPDRSGAARAHERVDAIRGCRRTPRWPRSGPTGRSGG